jgi:hypothetical protein
LFVATWSLSETPAHVRESIMPTVEQCAGVLIAYWRVFGETNNHEYFSRWAAEHPAFAWSHQPIPSLPGHFYLFGTQPRGATPRPPPPARRSALADSAEVR